jgi:histidinol-phosphate aminotransferase
MARINTLVEERTRVVNELTKQGWNFPAADGNFVWLNLKEKATEFALKCEEVGLSVRVFANDGVRITIAEKTANERLIEVALKFRD